MPRPRDRGPGRKSLGRADCRGDDPDEGGSFIGVAIRTITMYVRPEVTKTAGHVDFVLFLAANRSPVTHISIFQYGCSLYRCFRGFPRM